MGQIIEKELTDSNFMVDVRESIAEQGFQCLCLGDIVSCICSVNDKSDCELYREKYAASDPETGDGEDELCEGLYEINCLACEIGYGCERFAGLEPFAPYGVRYWYRENEEAYKEMLSFCEQVKSKMREE